MDHQDWVESFDSEEDRESFDHWLQELEQQELAMEEEIF